MTLEQFKSLLDNDEVELEGPLKALWEAGRGQWDAAHAIVQDDPGQDAAWVHALVHRQEGDLGNAGYWYRRAGKPVEQGSLEDEWDQIAYALLNRPDVQTLQ